MTPAHEAADVALRIVVLRPVEGVTLRLQRGRAELVGPTTSSPEEAVFDFTARLGAVRPDGGANLLGPFTQGAPAVRFVYLNAGRAAGQPLTFWNRRAKIPLTSISMADALAAHAPGVWLEVRIEGRGRDGGPVCASIHLPDGAWRLCRSGTSHPGSPT